jgi:hypothetical protein
VPGIAIFGDACLGFTFTYIDESYIDQRLATFSSTALFTASSTYNMPYNIAVARPGSGSSSAAGTKPPKTDRTPPPHRWLENIGLIVVVILILAITITRYWHNIHWSAR